MRGYEILSRWIGELGTRSECVLSRREKEVVEFWRAEGRSCEREVGRFSRVGLLPEKKNGQPSRTCLQVSVF